MGYRCPACEEVFEKFRDLRIHYSKQHKDFCPVCYSRYTHLVRHLKLKSDDYPHFIVLCIFEGFSWIKDEKVRKLVKQLTNIALNDKNEQLFKVLFKR